MGARSSAVIAEPAGGGRLWRALSVQPDERSKVMLTGATFFVVMASASIGLNSADALFFLRFGVESLPWMIMLSGVVIMIVTIAHAAALGVLGTRLWSWAVALIFAGIVAAERAAIAADLPGIYPVVWLTGQAVIYVGLTVLWDVAGELADARQAKRLFPLFMSAGIAGSVTGNALTGPLAGLLGTENLLVVEAVGLGLAAVIAKITTQRFVARRSDDSTDVLGSLAVGFRTTVDVPLFRLVAGVGAALSILFFLVFFPFSEVAAASFDTEESLAGFLGWFSSAATAATLLVSLFVAKRLFTRFGVVAVLLIVAVVYVAGFSAWLVSLGLVTATLFRGLQWVAVNALAATAFSSLFNVLTGATRAQTRDFVAAVPVQIGTVIAGALLLAGRELSQTARTVVSLGLAVSFLLMVVPMRRAYAAALVEAIRHGLSDVFTATMPGMQKPHRGADSLKALVEATRDTNPARRRVAAAILTDVGGPAAVAAIRNLLTDPDETVRLEALQSLDTLAAPTLVDDAVRCIDDPALSVRRCALQLLTGEQADHPAVRAALDDPDCEVRAQAARIVGGQKGREIIEAMVASGDVAAITAAMRCVLDQPDLAHIDPRPYATHDDAAVRRLAAALLGKRHDTTQLLRALVDDPSSAVRLEAAHSLAVADRSAIHDVLNHGTVRARDSALEALVAEEERDPYLSEWAEAELDRAAQLHRLRLAIASRRDGASHAAEYLVTVLELRERMVERWVVTALATRDTREVLPIVARGAISGSAETRAEALEAIESMADRSLARRLVALFESPAGEDRPDRAEALRALATDHQPWFRALALRTMHEEFQRDLLVAAEEAAADESDLVRTAIPHVSTVSDGNRGDLSTIDKVLVLQQASIFEQLDPEELEALAEVSRERRFESGELVYAEGSPGDEMLMVVGGAVDVRIVENGGPRIIAHRGVGEPIGELGVLRRQPRMADVVAADNGLHAVTISGDDFVTAIEEYPGIATALLAKLAERIATKVDRAPQRHHSTPGR